MNKLRMSLLVLALPFFAYAETPPTAQAITEVLAGLGSEDGRENYIAQETVREWSYSGTAWEQRGSEVVEALYGEVETETTPGGRIQFPVANAAKNREWQDSLSRKLDSLKTLRHLHNQKVSTKLADKECHDLFVFYLTCDPSPSVTVVLEVFDVYNLPSEELDRLLVAEITRKVRGVYSLHVEGQLNAARVYVDRRRSVEGVRWHSEVADALAEIYVGNPLKRAEAKGMLLNIVTDLGRTGYEPSPEVDHALLLIGRELNVLPSPSELCRLVTEASARALPPTEVVE